MTSTVYIAKNVYGGDGLGRLGDGRVVFVQGAWAGEQVKAEIFEEKRNYVKARLVEVVERSPDRIDAGAEGALPGMVYAGISRAGELKAKDQQLREFLERARIGVGDFKTYRPDGSDFLHYRNKVTYHFAKYGNAPARQSATRDGGWRIGYRMEPSHEIVDVTEDPLARPEINAKLADVRRSVTMLLTTGPVAVRRETERKGNVTVRWTRKTGVKWWIGDAPADLVMKETTCGLDFEVPAGGFYQVNPEVAEELAKSVTEAYARGSGTAPELLDLYCGVGVLGLCCRPPKLTGVESGRQAVEFAKRNAASQHAAGTTFLSAQVGSAVRKIPVGARTTVILDPPRGGLEPNVPKWLVASGAPRLIYVSCDPATLTRDLRTLVKAYDVESVRWFDMFPRTARFETLVSLNRRQHD